MEVTSLQQGTPMAGIDGGDKFTAGNTKALMEVTSLQQGTPRH